MCCCVSVLKCGQLFCNVHTWRNETFGLVWLCKGKTSERGFGCAALAVLVVTFIRRGQSNDQSGNMSDNLTIVPGTISPTMAPSSSLQETILMEHYEDLLSLIYDDNHNSMDPLVVESEQHLALQWLKSLSISDVVAGSGDGKSKSKSSSKSSSS